MHRACLCTASTALLLTVSALLQDSGGDAGDDGGGMLLLQVGFNFTRRSQGAISGFNDKGSSYHWPSGRGRVSQYAVSEHKAPLNLSDSLAWSWHHPKGKGYTLPYGTAIDEASNIYLSAADGMRKFNPEGKLLWEFLTLPAEVTNAASLYRGAVYNSDTHGNVFSLDMVTGSPRWKTRVSKRIGQDNGFVMVHDEVVVIASDHGPTSPQGDANQKVRGLNSTDGADLWSYKPDMPVWNFLALFPDDGTFVFQDMGGKAYRCNLSDGELLWKAGGVSNTWTDGSVALGPNGVVYAVNNLDGGVTALGPEDSPGHLSAYRLSNGELLWREVTPKPPNNAPAVGKLLDGKLSVIMPLCQQVRRGAHCDVYAYDAETGAVRWVFKGPAQKGITQAGDEPLIALARTRAGVRPLCLPNGWSAPSISGDGTVYIGEEEGFFFALRDVDGNGEVKGPKEVSSFSTQSAFSGSASPSIAPGTVAVASCDSLYVFTA